MTNLDQNQVFVEGRGLAVLVDIRWGVAILEC